MKTLNLVLSFTVLIGLVACGKPTTAKRANFQGKSTTTLQAYAQAVSLGYKKNTQALSPMTGALGITSTYYGDTGTGTTSGGNSASAGGYYTDPSYYLGGQTLGNYGVTPAAVEAPQCVAAFKKIPPTVENFKPAISTLTRCLNRIIVQGNPMMSYGYQNLDSQGQNLFSYLMNWRQPGQLQGFDPNAFNGLLNLIPANGW